MPKLFESGADSPEKKKKTEFSVVTGFITNNCDLLGHGKVQVRIPSMDQEVWARMTAPGAGSQKGFFYAPDMNDEVLVALIHGDPTDAFILGGLWNTKDRPPALNPPVPTTKKLRTGLTPAVGHELEFDDALQSITITTSTKQTIVMDPTKIEISTTGGTVKISLDVTTQSLTIQAVKSIEMKALDSIKLQAANIQISGGLKTEILSAKEVSVMAPMVKLNSP
jgi:uncharacterized protein involved in type VI secretion and phage assembly